MTQPAPSHPRPSDQPSAALTQPLGRTADIEDLIMADHRRIRRLHDALYDAARYAGSSAPEWVPVHVWQRFTGLLVAHFRTEEDVCYLPINEASPDAAGRRQAMADHGDIRRAIDAASLQPAGSAPWWRAVTVALTTSMDHLDREESGFLADCLPRMTPDQRRMLGRQWMVLAAARRQIESGEPQAR
jgi:Hemerythrin HHE cation binding domain